MKKIETFIHPTHWDHMHAALAKLGVSGTLRQVKTFGRIPPRREVYRGSAYVLETCNELELSLTVPDELLDATMAAISAAAADAELIVSPVQVWAGNPASRPRAVAGAVVPERPARPVALMTAVRV